MIFRRSLVRELTATAVALFLVLLAILFTNLVLRLLARAAGGSVAPDGILALLGFNSEVRGDSSLFDVERAILYAGIALLIIIVLVLFLMR